MIAQLTRRVFSVRYRYDDPISQQRAAGLVFVCVPLALLAIFWLSYFAIQSLIGAPIEGVTNAILIMLVIFQIIVAGLYFLAQTGRLQIASWIFVATIFVINSSSVNRLDTAGVMGIFPAIIAAALLLGYRGVIASTLSTIPFLIFAAISQNQLISPEQTIPSETTATNLATAFTFYLEGLLFLFVFGGNIRALLQRLRGDLEKTRQSAQFGSATFGLSENQIYQSLINFTRDDFGFDQVLIYIADDSGVLKERYDETFGGGRISIGAPPEILSEVATTHEMMILSRSDTNTIQGYFMPSSNYGVAVPIVFNDRVTAVMDVQSFQDKFTDDDTHTLNILAHQCAIAIEYTRQIDTLNELLQNQATAAENLRHQLRSGYAAPSEDFTPSQPHITRGPIPGYDLDSDLQNVKVASDMTPEIRRALATDEMVVLDEDGIQQVLLPIKLRGEIVGAMSFEIPTEQPITDQKLEMAQGVVNRLAFALENKRLFEQSQLQANRERRASEIGNQLIGATDVDSVLELATTVFNDALNAVNTRITIQPETLAVHQPSQNGGNP